MKTLLSSLAILGSFCISAQNFQYLDINQVKAGVGCSGNLHYNQNTNTPYYEVPKNSGKHTDFVSGVWIGGIDNSSQLKLAGQIFPSQTGVDFWPGPLKISNATTDSITVNNFTRVWKLNQSDINDFIINFNNGNVQNGTYIPAADLLSWPGNGPINYAQNLAPFFDINGDGLYNPTADGDYPIIKGDQAIFYIINDAYKPHQSGGQIIGTEIHVMVYAFGTCSVVASNPYLDYTTFYDYKIINRNSFNLYNSYLSLFDDADIGFYGDDYVGCDVMDEYGYLYTATLPANEPVTGYQLLKKPFADANDGIDNDRDGIIDEFQEELYLSGFYYFNNSFAGIPVAMTDPDNATQYYQYMTGYWRDSTPFTCGGNAYGGSIPSQYTFPSNTFTTGTCGASNWIDPGNGSSLSDKRYLISCGPFTIMPGGEYELEFAHVTAYDSINNHQLIKLDQDMNALKSFYNSSSFNSCVATGLKENEKSSLDFQMYPNPTNSFLTLSPKDFEYNEIQIIVSDVLGNQVLNIESKDTQQITLNLTGLPSGVYFIKLTTNGKSVCKKLVKQ